MMGNYEVKMKTILIADPDPFLRKALALLLRSRFGLEDICESRDMLSFAVSMADCAPKILIFNPAIYNLTALEACLLLRQTYPALELVLLSVNSDDLAAAQEAGACFIHKGENPEKLIATLKSLFGHSPIRPDRIIPDHRQMFTSTVGTKL
jgi:DNA-binding NarL/FixJ family response regulator